MTEKEEALLLANRLLDEPNVDPDDDLRMLARQLVRRTEEVEWLQRQVMDYQADPQYDQQRAIGQEQMRAEVERLRSAIVAHRSQKADDRCIEDDDRLYEALGDGIPCDRRVGSKEAMLQNCQRFIERRCEGGGWPTYQELEKEVEVLRSDRRVALERLRERCAVAARAWVERSEDAGLPDIDEYLQALPLEER